MVDSQKDALVKGNKELHSLSQLKLVIYGHNKENVARSLARDYVELKYRAHSGFIAYLWSAVQRNDDQFS